MPSPLMRGSLGLAGELPSSGSASRRRCPTPRANTVDGQLRLVYRQVIPHDIAKEQGPL